MDQPRASRMLGKHSTAAALDPRSLITHSCQRTLGSEKFIDTNLSCGLETLSLCGGCLQPGQHLRRNEPQLSLGKTSRLHSRTWSRKKYLKLSFILSHSRTSSKIVYRSEEIFSSCFNSSIIFCMYIYVCAFITNAKELCSSLKCLKL